MVPEPTPSPDPSPDPSLPPPPSSSPSTAGVGRRRFLLGAGGLAVTAAAGVGLWQALVRERTAAVVGAPSPGTTPPPMGERVLVVVQLGGGNDALNALVPADGRYLDARPTLGVPEVDRLVLPGVDAYGLHPALTPLLEAWGAGELALVAGTGIEGQSRSHFQALDTWWSARPGQVRTTGWLGRWLDATEDEDPGNPLRAVALGAGAPALVGERSTATVVLDPSAFRLAAPRGVDADALAEAWLATAGPVDPPGSSPGSSPASPPGSSAGPTAGPLLAAARAAVPTTVTATRQLAGAFDEALGVDAAPGLPDGGAAGPGRIAELLQATAAVIDHGLGTRVVHVGVGGFDTHAGQAQAHPALLADLAAGLAGLREAAVAGGWADRLLVVTVSDFGRRVVENGSGTDHGAGGLQLVGGTGVAGGQVVGALDLGTLVDGDLAPVVDGRSVYAAALDWLGGPTDDVLGQRFDRLGLLG